ncbi:MAG: chemotaxis protein CheA [Bacillota bacterium]|nr:chemotaxis protein CheA [Bacillota bacterium]
MVEENLQQIFIEEATDLLKDLENSLIELEDRPTDFELINQIFRAMHTIKGSAALTGMTDISDFVHHAEDLLDQIRHETIEVNPDIIDILLKSSDLIKEMVNALYDSSIVVPKRTKEELIESINYFKEPEENVVSESRKENKDETEAIEKVIKVKVDLNESFFATGTDPILLIEDLAELGRILDININLTRIPELFELKPENCYLKWQLILKTKETIEQIHEVFLFVESDNNILVEDVTEDFDGDFDKTLADKLTGEILVERGIIDAKDIRESLETQNKLGDILETQGKVSKEQIEKVVEEQSKSRKIQEKSKIKVDADKLENLINSMADLVISQARLRELTINSQEKVSRELSNALDEMDTKIRTLQEDIMSTRMIPVGNTFIRYKRLVRDLSQEQNKDVNFILKGKETELDKTVIEKIADPLKHMIRNAIDHGIETPEERKAAGKDSEASLELKAYHKEGKVIIEVSDDGAGLNQEKILKKAIENGIITPEDELSEVEIYNLIMAPGFSTKEVVTETSGRGVGMDVVKNNIENLRGSVNISSEKGKGTTFRLKLPLTLAIIDGMKVKVGNDYFIIPLNSIVEFIRPKPEHLKTIESQGEAIQIRENYLSLARLYKILEIESNVKDPAKGLVVVVQEDNKQICILVDEIIGQQQAVIKSLEDNYTYVEGMAGAAILGDGNVAMILDIATIIKMSIR